MSGIIHIILALCAFVVASCSNPNLDKIDHSGSSGGNDIVYEAAISSWMDSTLGEYYLYNDDYKKMPRNTSLSYDIYLNSTLMNMTTNVLDKKSYNVNGYLYSQLYSYITRKSVYTITKSSDSTAQTLSSVGYGFTSIEFLTLLSGGTGYTSWINVQGVYNGSEAAKNGFKRGSVITIIDGVNVSALTASEVQAKLMSPTAGRATTVMLYNEGEARKFVQLTAQATEINPILKSDIIEDDATGKKVGYLLYSSFESTYDYALKDEIARFNSAGISDLILDLRINGGGYISSATLLSSMLGGDLATDKKFSYYRYNNDLTANYGITESLSGAKYDPTNSRFYEMFDGTIDAEHKLNLSRIYCLVSDNTASASEMVINSLRGIGIDVILIGDTYSINDATNGKNAGMILFTRNTLSYSYEFAPITFEIFNGNGDGEYQNGFTFDHKVNEYNSSYYLSDYDETEPLIAKALELITSTTRSVAKIEGNSSTRQTDDNSALIQSEKIHFIDNSSRGAVIPSNME